MTFNPRRSTTASSSSSSIIINRMANSRSQSCLPQHSHHVDTATVINATALPRSVSLSNAVIHPSQSSDISTQQQQQQQPLLSTPLYEQSSSSTTIITPTNNNTNIDNNNNNNNNHFSSEPLLSEQYINDSLARDPFVSISRAIQSAKIRATTALGSKANFNNHNLHYKNNSIHNHRAARFRYMLFTVIKRHSRLFFALIVVTFLFFISLLYTPSIKSSRQQQQQQTKPLGSFLFPSFLNINNNNNNNLTNNEYVKSLSALEYFKRHRPPSYNSNPHTLTNGPWMLAFITDLDKASCHHRDYSSNLPNLIESNCPNANVWISHMKRAILTTDTGTGSSRSRSPTTQTQLKWLDQITLENIRPLPHPYHVNGNRAMELSDLIWFHQRLVTPDDRTGALLQITSARGALDSKNELINSIIGAPDAPPSHISPSISQNALVVLKEQQTNHPFKAEWIVCKDDLLIIGGHGRPYTESKTGKIISDGPMWVKTIQFDEHNNNNKNHQFQLVQDENWTKQYEIIAKASGISSDNNNNNNNNNHGGGYLMHEAVLWSHARRQWIFLPRRRSTDPFDTRSVFTKGWNGIITCDEHFNHPKLVHIKGLYDPSGLRGFSAATFLPGSDDTIVIAIRTVEVEGDTNEVEAVFGSEAPILNLHRQQQAHRHGKWIRITESYVSIFNVITGEMVMEESKFSDLKFEGVAVI